MIRLKNILQFNAGKFIHIGIVSVLFLLSFISYLAIGLLLLELYLIFRKSKSMIVFSLFIVLALFIKIYSIDNNESLKSLPLKGEVIEVFSDSFYFKTNEKFLCYYENTDGLEPGMIIEIEGNYFKTSQYDIQNTFDYSRYLKSKNIKSVIYVNNIEILNKKFNIMIFKHEITKHIELTYDDETAGFLKLFILGISDNEVINREISSEIGISHILAISGMHIGILVSLIVSFLKRFYISKSTIDKVVIIFLIAYNIITGFKISIMRASLLIIGIYLKNYLSLLLSKTDITTFSMVIFLFINPYYVYSVGFQLSYLITYSLILSSSIFKKSNKITMLTKTSILATAVSLPIIINMNNHLGLVFIYANIFFILYLNYLLIPACIIVLILPQISDIYKVVILVFNYGVTFFSNMNVLVSFNFPTNLTKILYWSIIVLFITKFSNLKKKTIMLAASSLILFFLMLNSFESNVFVRFLDVDQGDSIHIHDGNCDILIDTGSSDKYDNLIKYFDSYNIKDIDILLITHFHEDHYGEMHDLINNLQIKNVFLNKNSIITNEYNSVILSNGDKFTCGSSKFQVLNANNDYENENNNSIVLLGEIGYDKYLFTGDIEAEIEQKIIDSYKLDIDILKVSHHGSNTSSTQEFLESIKAKLAVISVGEFNNYDLPNSDVIYRLNKEICNVLRTDQIGTITIYYNDILKLRIIETYKKQKLKHYTLKLV